MGFRKIKSHFFETKLWNESYFVHDLRYYRVYIRNPIYPRACGFTWSNNHRLGCRLGKRRGREVGKECSALFLFFSLSVQLCAASKQTKYLV